MYAPLSSAVKSPMRPTTYSFDEEAPPDDPNQPKFIYSRSISAAVYLSHVRSYFVASCLFGVVCVAWALTASSPSLSTGLFGGSG
jgi:hypothetical protein